MAGEENAKELNKRENRQFERKENLDALNQELAYNFYPYRADFTAERCLGQEYCRDIFDSAPLLARRDLANARASMLRPRSLQWAKVTLRDKDLAKYKPVAEHLDWMNQRMMDTLYRQENGFVNVMRQVDNDVVTFGNGVNSCEPHRDTDNGKLRPLFESWHLRDCVWLDAKGGQSQDYFARRFKASARHIRKEFPDAQLAPAIMAALDDDKDKEFTLCHTMLLADEYGFYSEPKKKAKWASVYYDSDHQCILSEASTDLFMYAVDRWEKVGRSQYYISPAALTALADARGMQGIMQVLIEASEKALDPPVKATQGAILGEVNNYGGGITWVKADYDEKLGPAIELLAPRTNPPSGIELKLMFAQAMRDEWYISKLVLPPASHERTASEVQRLHEDFIRANIPLFEPWEAGTEKVLDNGFNVMLACDTFGDMREWPDELSEADLVWEFSNPLQDAIEHNKVNIATTCFGLIAAGRQADPNMPMPADVALMVQGSMRGAQAPAEWITDLDKVRAEQAAMQQQGNIIGALGQAEQAANIVKTGSEAAANVQNIMQQPAADGSFAYGPS